jgi:hypothetical protein
VSAAPYVIDSAIGQLAVTDPAAGARFAAALAAATHKPAPLRRNFNPCPTCGVPMPGLLATCSEPVCVDIDTAYVARYERGCDDL